MKNELTNLGKSLGKDTKESKTNTGRIQTNLPQIERKLDIISGNYDFKMDIPLSDVSSSVSLDLRFRADNCCECEAGPTNSTRRLTGDITIWKDANGVTFIPNQPADNPQNNVEFMGIVTSYTTVGILDSAWFAWPGYPWFFPNGIYEDDYSENAYGDFLLQPNGEILVPIGGVYNITFKGSLSGTTTATTKIAAMIKKRVARTGLLEVITSEILSVQKGNLEPDALIVGGELVVSAICYGFEDNDTFSAWIVTQDMNNLDYSSATITSILMGQGMGQISGYVFHDAPHDNPIEGASVKLELPNYPAVFTDAQGKYVIVNVIPGIHTVKATYSTFSASQKVTVERNAATSNVNFIL